VELGFADISIIYIAVIVTVNACLLANARWAMLM